MDSKPVDNEKPNQQILFVTHYSGMYGANQSLCSLIIELRKSHGIRPLVLLPRSGPVCTFLEKHDIPYTISHFYWWVNENSGLFQWLLNWRKQFINRFRVKKIVSLFNNKEISLVYSNSVTINMGALLAKKMGLPHIWHFRESLEQFRFNFSMGRKLSRKFLENGADRYLLISKYLKESYSDLLPNDKMEIVYNGVSIDEKKLQSEKVIGEKIKLCMVGVISEQKNQMDAVQALHRLLNTKGVQNVELHLVGGHKADYLKRMNAFVNENRLEEQVILHGHTDDVHAVLRGMHIGLMCSRDEAFGRVTIEYMLHRMPVIASRSGANEELVKEGVNGALYTLFNSGQLSDIIMEFIQSPERILSEGKEAHSFAIQNLSMEKNAREIARNIYDLLDKPQQKRTVNLRN